MSLSVQKQSNSLQPRRRNLLPPKLDVGAKTEAGAENQATVSWRIAAEQKMAELQDDNEGNKLLTSL